MGQTLLYGEELDEGGGGQVTNKQGKTLRPVSGGGAGNLLLLGIKKIGNVWEKEGRARRRGRREAYVLFWRRANREGVNAYPDQELRRLAVREKK